MIFFFIFLRIEEVRNKESGKNVNPGSIGENYDKIPFNLLTHELPL